MYSTSDKVSHKSHYIDKSQLDPYVKKLNAKLIQVIQNFFSKSAQIVFQARTLHDSSSSRELPVNKSEDAALNKVNKWFNIHMYNANEIPKEDLKLWKSFHDLSDIPPMIIETYLDLRQLSSNQTVVLKDDNGNPWTVAKSGTKKQEIVLERWLIEFDLDEVSGSIVDELPLIYKQAIILFRSLYGFSYLMPAYKLKKKLAGNRSSVANKLTIGNKILDGKQPISSRGRIGLSKSIIPHQMLPEYHLSQKNFQPIRTTLGTLKVSIAYRNHHDFCIHENEEVLSTQFISMDTQPSKTPKTSDANADAIDDSELHIKEPSIQEKSLENVSTPSEPQISDNHAGPSLAYKRFSIASNNSMSVSPCSSGNHIMREQSPGHKKLTPPIQRSTIQPFKIGSIGNSPPPPGPHTPTNVYSGGGSSLERRISITSNKSASNASLAALLRNPRSSTSSTHTTATNIPITNSGSTNTGNTYNSSFPRSISSSHGSNLQQDDHIFSNPDSASNTPRFSSSFGSRASRRFSSNSTRQSTHAVSTGNEGSILGTSAGLAISSGAPLSGLYIDDDISDFVRMIDSKTDLRFSSLSGTADAKSVSPFSSGGTGEALNKFHMLKNQHQKLGDSVSASLILHHNQIGSGSGSGIVSTGSRQSSRKSSHSINTPSPSLPSGSYDNAHLPSINSRLKEGASLSRSLSPPQGRRNLSHRNSFEYSSQHSNASFLKPGVSNKLLATPITSTNTVHATIHGSNPTNTSVKKGNICNDGTSGISGMATTPSAYQKKGSISYENVFDDEEDDEDYYHRTESAARPQEPEARNHVHRFHSHHTNQSHSVPRDDEDDEDDLLFTMSDMNLTKN